jgi:hypothetical protein
MWLKAIALFGQGSTSRGVDRALNLHLRLRRPNLVRMRNLAATPAT